MGPGLGDCRSCGKCPPPIATMGDAVPRLSRRYHGGSIIIFVELGGLAATETPQISFGRNKALASSLVGERDVEEREHIGTRGDILVCLVIIHREAVRQPLE